MRLFSSRIAPALSATLVTVAPPLVQQEKTQNAPRPAHHANDSKSSFVNPWPSFRPLPTVAMIKYILQNSLPQPPEDLHVQVRHQKPTWRASPSSPTKIKATWLGHACFFVELPVPEGASRGATILFDPVFSNRCSPSQYVGPARHIKPPCEISEIPEVAVVVISHNHYDHLDTHTIKTLEAAHQPHFFAPLGNESYFKSLQIPEDRIHCLDWWDRRDVTVELPGANPGTNGSTNEKIKTSFAVTCTPAQHFTGRGILDRFCTLWSSWAVEDLGVPKQSTVGDPAKLGTSSNGVKLWFAGDTGYRTVYDGENEDEVPVCPEFKNIGEKFGEFDLAFIPIGAYQPRGTMSPIHCAPQDSVRIFKDVKAKKAIGMHWGTWALTYEPLMEPPKRLAEERAKIGIADGLFEVCGMGETVEV